MGLFVEDVRRAVRMIGRVRWLLPVALGVGLVGAGLSVVGGTPAGAILLVLGPAWFVVSAGWIGTERVVIVRAARGEELDSRNVWASIRVVGPRLVRLGFAVLPVAVLLVVAAAAWGPGGFAFRLAFATAVFVVAVALTFVTPALVLTTSRVRDAIPIGWRLLRVTWPRTWAHAVLPAAALALATAAVHGPAERILVVEGLALVLRGATALRYVDLVDVAWREVPGGVWRRRVRSGTTADAPPPRRV